MTRFEPSSGAAIVRALIAFAMLGLAGAASRTALAGPNANGTLIVHENQTTDYTTDPNGPYCGTSGLASCGSAVSSATGTNEVIFHVFAAFPSNASPSLKKVAFGVSYPGGIQLVDYGLCGDSETSTSEWPDTGQGTVVQWGTAKTSTLVELYWFTAYNYFGNAPSASFCITAHPVAGGKFFDGSIPEVEDAIAAYGCFGFDTSGSNTCPSNLPTGACCFANGSCQVQTAAACATAGGSYSGDGTDCTPNDCAQPTGACCAADGSCQELTSSACTSAGGDYSGDGTDCTPNNCPQPSTGGCCHDNGSCTIVTQASCVGGDGTYQGDGTDCTPNPCPPAGACCIPPATCSLLTEDACTDANGAWAGDGTVCAAGLCDGATGACCLSAVCVVYTQDFCELQDDASYVGDGTDCDPTPCPTATRKQSWGQIKAQYR